MKEREKERERVVPVRENKSRASETVIDSSCLPVE